MKDRVKSFNTNSTNIKWTARKCPTKAAMARAFYRFVPTLTNNDQVECDLCQLKLSGWQNFKGNPITRHSGLNPNCPISKLGTLVMTEQQSYSHPKDEAGVDSASFTHAEVLDACSSTFPGNIPEELKTSLASIGFVYLQTSPQCNTPLYGCISCNSQSECGSLTHKPKCAVSRMMKSLTLKSQKSNVGEHKAQAKPPAKEEIKEPKPESSSRLLATANETTNKTVKEDSASSNNVNNDQSKSPESTKFQKPRGECSGRPSFMTMEPFPAPKPKSLNPVDLGIALQAHRSEVKLWFDRQLLHCFNQKENSLSSDMISNLMKYTLKQTDVSIMKLNNLMTCYYEVKFEKPTNQCAK